MPEILDNDSAALSQCAQDSTVLNHGRASRRSNAGYTGSLSAEVTVLIADPTRIAALRDEVRLPGRVLPFASSNLGLCH